MEKIREIPDTVEIDWEKAAEALANEDFSKKSLEVKIDFDLIDKEVDEAMKCAAIVPERKHAKHLADVRRRKEEVADRDAGKA